MTRALMQTARLCAILHFSFFLSACDLFFKNPPQRDAADSGPFLGDWVVAEYLTQPPLAPMTASISLEPNGLLGIKGGSAGEEPMLHLGRLINVNGLVVMALERKTGSWLLLNLVLEDNGNRLTLRVPDLPTVRDAVAAGGLPGETYVIDRDDQLTIVTAESESLAQYIAAHPTFFNGAYAIQVRE